MLFGEKYEQSLKITMLKLITNLNNKILDYQVARNYENELTTCQFEMYMFAIIKI